MPSVIIKKYMIDGMVLIKDTQIKLPWVDRCTMKVILDSDGENMQAREILTFYAGFFKRMDDVWEWDTLNLCVHNIHNMHNMAREILK